VKSIILFLLIISKPEQDRYGIDKLIKLSKGNRSNLQKFFRNQKISWHRTEAVKSEKKGSGKGISSESLFKSTSKNQEPEKRFCS